MEPAKEASLEPPGESVKEPKAQGVFETGGPRFARRFDGWELGALIVTLVLSAALLAVPRAARPGLIPVPLADPADARASRDQRLQLVEQAQREGLPFETRAVGDAVRRLGVALAGGVGEPEHLDRLVTERVQAALHAGQEDALARLRAVQGQLFVSAVRAHLGARPLHPELAALGGDFASRAAQNGWVQDGRCVASDDELAILFARRWVELTHLRDRPRFRATLGEVRQFYRFLLLHPELGTESHPTEEIARALARLRYVEALTKRDTEYPLDLARGSLLAELGQLPQSAQALSRYLSRPAGAAFNLRARNYLIYAAASGAQDAAAEEP